MKEHSKASERELSNDEIANLSDGEFKALLIKMLTELIELGRKMKKQMKDSQNEIKQIIKEPAVTEGNQDSKQQFGTRERNKHPSRRKGRNKNSKK